MTALTHFIVYSRAYCHLCDDMIEALQALSSDHEFTMEEIDVDTDEELEAQYDELVPVLLGVRSGGETVQICNYHLDEQKVKAFLQQP